MKDCEDEKYTEDRFIWISEPDETYVFEDVIHAIRTANRAGFVTVGLYDKSGEGDQDLIRAESGIYLRSFENWERFRAEAGL